MRLYKPANMARQCVFDLDERDRIKHTYDATKDCIKHNGTPAGWNKNDREALDEILLWPQRFADGGKELDISEDQVVKIDKMLSKVFGEGTTLADLAGITLDDGIDIDDEGTYMGRKEMYEHCETRRKHEREQKSLDNVKSRLNKKAPQRLPGNYGKLFG